MENAIQKPWLREFEADIFRMDESTIIYLDPTSADDRCLLTKMPNELLQNFILSQLSARDGMALAQTCIEMYRRLLPELYSNDVREADISETPPFSLQWSCYFGVTSTAEASMATIQKHAGNLADVIERSFDGDVLDYFAAKRGRTSISDYTPYGSSRRDMTEKCRLLNVCCLRGHTLIAEILIKNGADVRFNDKTIESALHWTINPEVARFLVERGAVVDAESVEAKTPLVTAICRMDVIRLLDLVEGIRNIGDEPVENGNGALSIDHTVPNILTTIDYLIRAGANVSPDIPTPSVQPTVYHPLKLAIWNSEFEIVELLLKSGASPRPRKADTGREDVIVNDAITFGCADIALALLEAGARVEGADHFLYTPIIYLMGFYPNAQYMTDEWMHVADVICKHMSHIDRLFGGHTALHRAIRTGHWRLVKVLAQNGAQCGTRGDYLNVNSIRNLLDYLADC